MSGMNQSLRVALVWNGTVVQEKTFTRMSDPTVTVGEHEKNMFIVLAPGVPETFNMFERQQDGSYVLRFTDRVDGNVSLDDEEYDLDEAQDKGSKVDTVTTEDGSASVFEVMLKTGDWGLVHVSDTTQIFYQLVDDVPVAPRRGLIGAVTGLTAVLFGFIALSGIIHAALLLTAFLNYDPEAELNPLFAEDRFVEFLVDDPKDPMEEEEVEEPEEDTTGKKAGGEEGKFGAEDSEIPESKIPKVDGEMVDEVDVKNIGVNKALGSKLLGSGPLKNIFGDQEGFDAKMNVAMSGEGGELVVGRGAGGMGMRGTGSGGGGEGFGRVGGLGKVDTGGGKGMGGKIGKKKKKKVKVKMNRGAPKIGDFCDQGNIRRVVSAKSNAIKYCFEKELQANPKLSGKIIAQWKVGLDGSVMSSSIASSTMGNKKVEGCIARVIKRMRFQKPKGGICIINYPFVFSGLE